MAVKYSQAPGSDSAIWDSADELLPGNGAHWWDISAGKEIHFAERYRLEFRSEFFNAFNHTNFANPNVSPESPNFGRTFSTSVDPRTIQFGLKFYW